MKLNETVFSLRIEKELYAKLKAVSEKDRRSINSMVVLLIEDKIAKTEQINSYPLDYAQ